MLKKIRVLLLGLILVLSLSACTGGEDVLLPSFTGHTYEETMSILESYPLTIEVVFEENTTVNDGIFLRYGDKLSAGDYVKDGKEITIYFADHKVELPDLTDQLKAEVITSLDSLGFSYEFVYEKDSLLSENTFIRYSENLSSGDAVPNTTELVVVLSTQKNILPDLTGLDQFEIYTVLNDAGIDFVYGVVDDNTVEDQTFSSYGDGLTAGTLVPSTFTITVNIGYNSEKLPDLNGLVKKQIETELEDLGIVYNFEYVVNDDFAEDTFAGYKDASAGDFYESEVTVQLYKNTFTDNETSLIISKYVDGGDGTSDQAIEIYNATDSTINLNDYYLAIFSNGSFEESYHIDFGDIDLASGETYVIGNWNANGNLLVKADLSTTDLVFDGNDTIQLCYSNGTYIDTIYNLGDKDFAMDNEVYIRNPEVVVGTREFNSTEWSAFIPTYYDSIGIHPVEMPMEISIEIIARGFLNELGGMDLVSLSSSIDGDTARFTPGFVENSVRFLGVDTPETYPYTQPWGLEAKAYTKGVLENATSIYIQSDPDMGFMDTYGTRYLGLVWCYMDNYTVDILSSTGEVMRTEHLDGWILLNYHLILNGYSKNYYSTDTNFSIGNKYIYRWFQEAERYAAANGLGVHE